MERESERAYLSLAARLTRGGILSDPWMDGEPRFGTEPLVLSAAQDAALGAAAEAVTALHEEVARLCLASPGLIDRYFALTPWQRLMWEASAPSWHGIARADVFWTEAGPVVCELNCHTPSGEAEAVLLNAATRPRGLVDPNRSLGQRFCTLIETMAAEVSRSADKGTVGIIYPTELVEDLSMIRLYKRWLEARGFRVVLGSPYNLRRIGDRVGLFDEPCDVFVRHYKTDWWGERIPIWDDEPPFPDPDPLRGPLELLLDATLRGRCHVVNPFGSVLLQNKRAMALMWEELPRFPAWAQQAICAYVPYSARLEALSSLELGDRTQWVLKSDYGCESAEVVIGAECSDEEWRASLAHAIPHRWIAQRFFRARTDARGLTTNHGVYVVGGIASGYFTRVHAGATGYDSLTVPTLVQGGT
jgi:glutathionylspermidine synthase